MVNILLFFNKLQHVVKIAGTYTKSVLNKLKEQKQNVYSCFSRQKLIWVYKFLLWQMKSKISWGYLQRLEADVATLKNMNEKLLQRIIGNERQHRVNNQYLDCEWRWQAYPPLLMTQLWRTSCVKYFVKLGLKLMRGIHNPLIDLKRTNLERLSNLATGMTVWKCFERKLSFEILILLCWSFCKKQKKLLMRVCAPTIGAFGTIVKNLEGDI